MYIFLSSYNVLAATDNAVKAFEGSFFLPLSLFSLVTLQLLAIKNQTTFARRKQKKNISCDFCAVCFLIPNTNCRTLSFCRYIQLVGRYINGRKRYTKEYFQCANRGIPRVQYHQIV